MATVVVARHGRTAANGAGVLAGRTPGVHLDETGIQQVATAADRLAGLPLAAIVTSPLERCRETARAIRKAQAAGGHAITLHTDKHVAEVDYGQWQGRAIKDLAKEPLWRTVQQHPSRAEFPGGEGLADMSSRMVAAVRRWDARIQDEHGPDAVWLLVSHGDPIKALIADALGMHLDAFQRIVVEPASLSVIRYTTDRPFVVTTNSRAGDLSHLKPSPRAKRNGARRGDAVVGGGA